MRTVEQPLANGSVQQGLLRAPCGSRAAPGRACCGISVQQHPVRGCGSTATPPLRGFCPHTTRPRARKALLAHGDGTSSNRRVVARGVGCWMERPATSPKGCWTAFAATPPQGGVAARGVQPPLRGGVAARGYGNLPCGTGLLHAAAVARADRARLRRFSAHAIERQSAHFLPAHHLLVVVGHGL